MQKTRAFHTFSRNALVINIQNGNLCALFAYSTSFTALMMKNIIHRRNKGFAAWLEWLFTIIRQLSHLNHPA